MAQAGYTPIQLYYSTTAASVPVNTNLANGELAINIADVALFAKNSAGVVKRIMNNPASLKYPITDGSANQVISTDGAGNLTFSTPSAGVTTGKAIAMAMIFGF
jgi:hypothetical protein